MSEERRNPQHDLLNSLVAMPEAAGLAHLSVTPNAGKPTDAHRETMAGELALLVTLYSLSPSREQIQTLTASDLRGGRFVQGGSEIAFDDGRPSISDICMTRAALNIATQTIKQALDGRQRPPGAKSDD